MSETKPVKPTYQILDELTGATCGLVVDEPFYGHFFSGLLKEVHSGIQTMSVGPAGTQVKLHINPQFWTHELPTVDLRKGLIKHEILHVVFKHIFRGKHIKHKRIYNIACDLVVNQYVRANRLPESRVHLGLFADMDLEPEREAEYYYEELVKLYDLKMDGEGQDGNEDGESSGQAGASGGDGQHGGKGSDSWEVLKQLLEEDNEWQGKHDTWEEIDQLPQAMKEVLEQSVDQSIMNTVDRANVKGWGDIPGKLRAYLENFQPKGRPQVNWRRVLRLFTESSSRTYLRNTVRRPSKRYGTTPGIKIRRRQKLAVVIDTSASISPQEIKSFFSEIYHIWKRGAEVVVVECDTDIRSIYPYRGRSPESIEGRGGTKYDAPLTWANTQFNPDALIYFTDGFAPVPKMKLRYPILWVFSRRGITPDMDAYGQLPGRKVKMTGEGSSN